MMETEKNTLIKKAGNNVGNNIVIGKSKAGDFYSCFKEKRDETKLSNQ
jgi:hypothetical protein